MSYPLRISKELKYLPLSWSVKKQVTHRKPELASTYQEASIKETVMPKSHQKYCYESCLERIAAEAHQNIAARANQK